MKMIKLLSLLLLLFTILALTESCKKAEEIVVTCENGGVYNSGICNCPDGFSGVKCEIQDLCFDVDCENGGTCIDGTCDCPEGYTGTNCRGVDTSLGLQKLLDLGVSLKLLLSSNNNFATTDFYGKTYGGGYIVNIKIDGTGVIAAFTDAPSTLNWNDAVAYCRDLTNEGKDDWFLPSQDQLNLMWLNLADSDKNMENTGLDDPNNLAGFSVTWYWSSTIEGSNFFAWNQIFNDGTQSYVNKLDKYRVRPARFF